MSRRLGAPVVDVMAEAFDLFREWECYGDALDAASAARARQAAARHGAHG